MQFFPSFMLQSLAFILPLGFDTLGVSLSLGMRSAAPQSRTRQGGRSAPPFWLRSAILFASAEMLMPMIGLFIGYALSTIVGGVMHYIGVFLLIGIGLWELVEEGREYLSKRKKSGRNTQQPSSPAGGASHVILSGSEGSAPQHMRSFAAAQDDIGGAQEGFHWSQQLLLALSVSMDELAVGFSFGSAAGKTMSPFTFCLLIGLQAFLMTLIGLSLGRALRKRLIALKEWSELLSAILLIVLGVWLSFS